MKFFLFLLFVCISPEPEGIIRGLMAEDSQEEVVVACSSSMERRRHEIINQSKCGAPKEVFIEFKPKVAHEQVNPGGMLIKRCIGLCDYETFGSNCAPFHKVMMKVPVRVYNAKTNQERCVMYDVEEHVSCSCCDTYPCSGPAPVPEVVKCTPEHAQGYNENMQQTVCGGPPKDVFIDLKPQAAYEHVYPSNVWVKRCVGRCDFESLYCGAVEKVIRKVPVRVHDLRTNKESCMMYDIEEHKKCHCCDDEGCGPRLPSDNQTNLFLMSPEEDVHLLPV